MSIFARLGIRGLITALTPTVAAGERALIPRSDGWYDRDSSGTETLLGSGGGGGGTDEPGSLVEWGHGYVIPRPGSTTMDTLGATALTATGTVTGVSPALTNLYTRSRLVEYLVTTGSTTAVAGFRTAPAHMVRGNAAGVGGFYIAISWGPATGVATASNRAFVGIANTTAAPTDVQPSSVVNMICMGWDSTDANVQVMHNDASGTATKVDTGMAVPTTDRANLYRFKAWCAPNESKLNYEVTNLVTGVVFSGDTGASTDIPSNTTFLGERGWMSAGGTSSVIGIALKGVFFKKEAT